SLALALSPADRAPSRAPDVCAGTPLMERKLSEDKAKIKRMKSCIEQNLRIDRFWSSCCLLHHVAAVRAEDLTSHIRGFIGGKIKMRISNILRGAEFAHGNAP